FRLFRRIGNRWCGAGNQRWNAFDYIAKHRFIALCGVDDDKGIFTTRDKFLSVAWKTEAQEDWSKWYHKTFKKEDLSVFGRESGRPPAWTTCIGKVEDGEPVWISPGRYEYGPVNGSLVWVQDNLYRLIDSSAEPILSRFALSAEDFLPGMEV